MTNLKNIETTHLTIVERYLLTFIKYKTNNHHPFFMNNESIAQQIGCKVSSTKVTINKLIREGYILKMEGKNGRRELALSGKYYVPLDGVNMSNQEKSLLKQDIQNFERMEKQYKQDIAELKSARADLEHLCAMLRDAFLSKGYTINDIEKMVADEERKKLKNGFSENQNYDFSIEEQSKTIEKPSEMIEETPVIVNDNNNSVNETQAKINEILAKFQIPVSY